MQYWFCGSCNSLLIADHTGVIVGAVNDEEEAASVAVLAYHRDDRHDLVLAGLVQH